jgi:hypothetical protein
MGRRRPIYRCDQCSEEFYMYIVWDWVYAQALGVEPDMAWDMIAYTHKQVDGEWVPDFSHGTFRAQSPMPGILCEDCVEQNIGRKLCWWDYMHIGGNFPDVDITFFCPVGVKTAGLSKSNYEAWHKDV